MERLKFLPKAQEVTARLVGSKNSERAGYIAAVNPQTGEIFYGKTVAEAAKEGRKSKNDPKAIFFFVRVGYPSVHVLKTFRRWAFYAFLAPRFLLRGPQNFFGK